MGSYTDYKWRTESKLTRSVASPNYGPRPDGVLPSMVVLHYTAMEDCAAAERALCLPEKEVSAHYLISQNGIVTQLVSEENRA